MYYLIMAELCFALLLAMTFVMCRGAIMAVRMTINDCHYINVLGWKVIVADIFLTIVTVAGAGFTLFLSGSLTILHFYL